MRDIEALFYPEQIVTGRVIAMNDGFASIDVQGQVLPLENRFINWNSIGKPSAHLRLGERIQAVVHSKQCKDTIYACRTLTPRVFWQGFWLDRLPLLDDPWPHFKSRHPEGSILEVEFLGYTNFYVAKVRTESGFIIELMNSDLHPSKKSNGFDEALLPYQFIQIAIRRFSVRTVRAKRLR